MTGFIRDIMQTECPRPNDTPKYYEEDEPVAESIETLPNVKALEDELMALKVMEEELAALDAIEQEKEILEALMMEQAQLEAEEETDQKKRELAERMVADMATMGFPQDVACLAVQSAKNDWGEALDFANQHIQPEPKRGMEEDCDKVASAQGRMPATPCQSDSMPPPPVPAKRLRCKKPDPVPQPPAPICILNRIWIHL